MGIYITLNCWSVLQGGFTLYLRLLVLRLLIGYGVYIIGLSYHSKNRRFIMSRPLRYGAMDLIREAPLATSFIDLAHRLGVKPESSNYSRIRGMALKFKVDLSHLHSGPTKLTKDYLAGKYPIPSDQLRKRLLKDGIFPHKCMSCQLTTWMDQPIPLTLHHKDGDLTNNQVDNLELLCPNCRLQKTKTTPD